MRNPVLQCCQWLKYTSHGTHVEYYLVPKTLDAVHYFMVTRQR